MRVQVEGRQAAIGHESLSEYMSAANLRFVDLPPDGALTANIVNFPTHTFAHVVLPPALIEWPRDIHSRNRVLVLVTADDRFEVHCDGPVIRKEPGFILVPPGIHPVLFRTRSAATELIYVSSDVTALGAVRIVDDPDLIDGMVPASTAVPLTGFVTALCSITSGGTADAGPIARVAREVARSLIAVFDGGEQASPSLFTSAMEIIVRDHARTELSGAVVASRLGVGTRTLQDAFAKEGTTVSAQLRAVRVRAAEELRERNPGVPLKQVAAATGFGSVSTLLRSLRREVSER